MLRSDGVRAYVPVPLSALAVGRRFGRLGRLAVIDLWEAAHATGYLARDWTEAGLAEEWDLSRKVVVDLLRALEATGDVVVTRSAPRSRLPSTVTVRAAVPSLQNQTGNQTGNQSPNQSGNQSPNQKNRPLNDASDDSEPEPEPEWEPVPEPVPEPEREPSRAGDPPRAPEIRSLDQISTTAGTTAGARARGPAEPDPEVIARLVSLQALDEPQHGPCMPSGREWETIRSALLRGRSEADLTALWAWSGVSEDPIVAGCRKGSPGWRCWPSLLKRPDGDVRVDAARAWHAAGRPSERPERRPREFHRQPDWMRKTPGIGSRPAALPPDLDEPKHSGLDAATLIELLELGALSPATLEQARAGLAEVDYARVVAHLRTGDPATSVERSSGMLLPRPSPSPPGAP